MMDLMKIKKKDEEEIEGKRWSEAAERKRKKNYIFKGYKFRILLELEENIRDKKVNVLVKPKRILM